MANNNKPGLMSRITGAITGGLIGVTAGAVVGAIKGVGYAAGTLFVGLEGMAGMALIGLSLLPAIAIGAVVGAGIAAYQGIKNGIQAGFLAGCKSAGAAAVTWEAQGSDKKTVTDLTSEAMKANPAYQASSSAMVAGKLNENPVKHRAASATPAEVTKINLDWRDKIIDPIKESKKALGSARDLAKKDLHNPLVDNALEKAKSALDQARKFPHDDNTAKFMQALESRITSLTQQVIEKRTAAPEVVSTSDRSAMSVRRL